MAVATQSFAGRGFARAELQLIREVVQSCVGLSRMELAHTVCELVGWTAPQRFAQSAGVPRIPGTAGRQRTARPS